MAVGVGALQRAKGHMRGTESPRELSTHRVRVGSGGDFDGVHVPVGQEALATTDRSRMATSSP
jgi:hypothetical protein